MRFTSDEIELSATDLSNHLSCEHLTHLNRLVALKELQLPHWHDPALEVLIMRGEAHEAAYVESLKIKGLFVVNLKGKDASATMEAMRAAIDVLAQARLSGSGWTGVTDILIKVKGQSRFGNWSYEVQDTKLTQHTRTGTLLQLALYSDLLSAMQDGEPEMMHVIRPVPDFKAESYRFSEFRAYYRMIKSNLRSFLAKTDALTYPSPVEHCSICRWWHRCDRQRRADDHLSLVAGIRSLHIEELQRQKITTLEAFAKTESLEKPKRGHREAFEKRKAQARIQWNGRIANTLLHEFLPAEPGRGLNRLPEPGQGDVYFDIEGDAFFDVGGLEYLLGYVHHNGKNGIEYKSIWSTNRSEEKSAFIRFMEFVMSQWRRYPNFYIYHYAPYEPSAIKRLARVHAVFESEVDDLLRAERFIDLHAVTKEALLASVERYSLKDIEKFTSYRRIIELPLASAARKAVEVALELHDVKSLPVETGEVVERYNEDDCRATYALQLWLESLRTARINEEGIFSRPPIKTGEASENVQVLENRAQAIFKSLTAQLTEDRAQWTEEHSAKWLLAHQIDYFRREDKSAWWEYYRVHELDYEDLINERKAMTGLQFVAEIPKTGKERNVTHRYIFPPQELSIDEGDELIEVKGEKIGSVKAISLREYTVDIKKTTAAKERHPHAVHVSERVDPGSLATSLMDLAAAIDEDGLSHNWPYSATKDLLMKRKPRLKSGPNKLLIAQGEDPLNAALRIAADLDNSILAIQGPPGSGKTYSGARMIMMLASAGKRIGITATSHKVIRNLIEKVIDLTENETHKVSFVHKVKEEREQPEDRIAEVTESKKAREALDHGKIIGGTAWLWAEKDSENVLDYLFVDEAGQMSLSHVVAASRCTRNIILLGDPQQLEQPQRGAHPEGSDVSALTYLLDGHLTMPEGKGLFLPTTRRLNPQICRFTSEIFYEGRLSSLPGLEQQQIIGGTPFDGGGLFYVPVHHAGNQNRSLEEIDAIAEIIRRLRLSGQWTASGKAERISEHDMLILAPYNAQVSALLEKFPTMRIGTVDKFQGQEAPVVIYSMTSSTVQDSPRGMNFLFNPNRLNVATSRAKCACILVASPKLFEAECHTIEQMRWANALCRYLELAKTIEISDEFAKTADISDKL